MRANLILGLGLGLGLCTAAYAEDFEGKEKTADASAFDAPVLNTPNSDELGSFMDGWEFGFHGYIRMAMRTNDSFFGDRPPYLIDDRYYKSGFAYTRLNEGSWAETQFSASRKNTRIVVGMFASEFSDWSKVTMEDQKGFAIGYVEQKWHPWEPIEFKLKAGMFWERFGYLEAYDTYLFGRTHIAGAALEARAFDGLVYAQYGHGAHLREANQGFTTLDWVRVGSDWKFADLSLYGMWVGSQDNDYAFNEDWKGTDGHLRILGADVKGAVPYFGKVYAALAYYSAESVGYLHGAVEVMHAADGSTLKNNYFGSVNNGTGEMQAIAWRADWEVHRTIDAFASRELASMFNGLNVSLFGLTAYVAADTKNKEDPKNNYNDRRYFKWGSELRYAPLAFDINPMPFVSVRYDRVILDTNHEGLSFNAITPRIGITPYKGIDVFLSYSHYDYGENIYTPNEVTQAVGTNVRPDEDVYKIQAQASW